MGITELVQIISLFALLVVSAFFSGSETALTSLSNIKIKKMCTEKPDLLSYFSSWINKPQYLLAAILVGNTAVNVAFSSLATILALSVLTGFHRWIVEGAVPHLHRTGL